jgi:putative ATP-binding cassette transporter
LLDEATSSVDAGLEHALYTLIRTRLPECTLVSVGHRSRLTDYHTHYLDLRGAGQWDVTAANGHRTGQRLLRVALERG